MEPELINYEDFEHNGLLWKRRRGAQSSSGEPAEGADLLQADERRRPLNPWLRDDYEKALEVATAVMQGWTRAEPDFRQWAAEEAQ